MRRSDAHFTRFAGLYVGSVCHRLNTETSIVSLTFSTSGVPASPIALKFGAPITGTYCRSGRQQQHAVRTSRVEPGRCQTEPMTGNRQP